MRGNGSFEARIGWKSLPLYLDSRGTCSGRWILVPSTIQSDSDINELLQQISPSKIDTLGASLGLSTPDQQLQFELFGYLIGICVGDAGKTSSSEMRFASMNLDLQLVLKHDSNKKIGDLVRLAASLIGIRMTRIADKHPTGATRSSKNPTDAYRWSSERSPFLASIVTMSRTGKRQDYKS